MISVKSRLDSASKLASILSDQEENCWQLFENPTVKSQKHFENLTKCPKFAFETLNFMRKWNTPIEVKSSGYKAHVSMDEFCKKFSQHIGLKYLLYTKDLRKDGDLWFLPVYLTQFI